jgi:hypothetical protein
VYSVTVGKAYWVVGMILWETMLLALIKSDRGRPYAVPVGLFETDSVSLPSTWRFAVGPGTGLTGPMLWERPRVATWGYDALVDDEDHLTELLEGGAHANIEFERHFTVPPEDET